MQRQEVSPVNFEWKQMIQEACAALTQLDADRLEELALSCRALNQAPAPLRPDVSQARAASAELSVLENILSATKANFEVLERMHRLREKPFAYDPAHEARRTARKGATYGDH